MLMKIVSALMTGLARDRRSIGSSLDGMSQLIGSTSQLLEQVRVPTVRAVHRFRTVMDLFMANRKDFVGAVGSFGSTLAALGRASSYENAVNIYLCTVIVNVGGAKLNLNGGDQGPYSEVCR